MQNKENSISVTRDHITSIVAKCELICALITRAPGSHYKRTVAEQ